MPIGALAGLFLLTAGVLLPNAAPARGAGSGGESQPSAQQRYDEARQLMQHERYAEAAEAYRAVADSDDAAVELRAQALFSSGLMRQNARDYQRASETYREVERRFPGTLFSRRAGQMVKALEEGGQGRWIEFRRRNDAASDVLFPAQALAEREELRAARPGLERAAALLESIVRDFADHPQAANVAITLGNTHMTLRQFGAACADYERAIALARSQSARAAPAAQGVDSIALDAEERLVEAVRSLRRQRVTAGARTLLAAIGLVLLALRPWRAADAPMLRFAGSLALVTLVLAVVAMGTAHVVRLYIDPNSPIENEAAGLLVALPGITGQLVALGFVGALRETLHWPAGAAARLAAAVGAIAALAVATCVVNAYALFPVLDSLF